MVSVTHAVHNVEMTAESLQKGLVRLEVQKQALERELAAVVAHLASVQQALSALETLMLNPAAVAAASAVGGAVAEQDQASTPVEPQTDMPCGRGSVATIRTWTSSSCLKRPPCLSPKTPPGRTTSR
jgi:hypothetical protein